MSNHIFDDSYQYEDDNSELVWCIHCTQCQAMTINGVPCHERGCPQAWRDEVRECSECGEKFYPEDKSQLYCGDYCCFDAEDVWTCRGCGKAGEPYEDGEEFCSERCAKEFWG